MAHIYEGAVVTLARPAAFGCYSRIIHRRPKPYQIKLQVSNKIHPAELILSHSEFNKESYSILPERNSPLAKRGWVLQDRLLPSRMLYFGSSHMYFECGERVHYHHYRFPVQLPHWAGPVTKRSINRLSIPQCFDYWIETLQTYPEMILTVPSDKFPALSGLASWIQNATNTQYVAGIWQEDFFQGLLWYISSSIWYKSTRKLPSKDYIRQAGLGHRQITSFTFGKLSPL